MSLAQPPIQDRRPSPGGGMSLKLNSNNPFRRAAEPAPATPPLATPPAAGLSPPSGIERPMSTTNPFLDNYQPLAPEPRPANAQIGSPPRAFAYDGTNKREATVNTSNPSELMRNLTVKDKLVPKGRPQPPHSMGSQSRGHHRQRSEDEKMRIRKGLHDNKANTLDIFSTSPEKPGRQERRRPAPRRNSDTSVLDVQEVQRKESSRNPDGRTRDDKSRAKKPSKRVDTIDKLDVTGLYGPGLIHHDGPFDACNPHRNRKGRRAAPMEAFAEGSLNMSMGGGPVKRNMDFDTFHGRGIEGYSDYNVTQARNAEQPPAATIPRRPVPEPRRPGPQRLESDPRRPPPATEKPLPQVCVTERSDLPSKEPLVETTSLDQASEYREPEMRRKASEAAQLYDPKGREYDAYGQETAGLGASTFLEGAPAPRSALRRQQSETAAAPQQPTLYDPNQPVGSLQRKKSLANRIRNLSQRRPPPPSDRRRETRGNNEDFMTPEAHDYMFEMGGDVGRQHIPSFIQSAGGRDKMYERNPFFADVHEEEPGEDSSQDLSRAKTVDSDQANFSAVRRSRTASSPHRAMMRKIAAQPPPAPPVPGDKDKENRTGVGGGLLTRVKSLKGGRRKMGSG